jgi:hypothetical protein
VVLSGAQRHTLPPRYARVGEALASDPAALPAACDLVGRELARDGIGLDEALDGLRRTARLVTRQEPPYAAVRAVAAGWSEATLGYLHQLSCEDPLTGLASLAHLRSRLAELYRDEVVTGSPVQDSHVLVVLDTPVPEGHDGEVFGSALRTARLAETARTVFPGGHTLGRVGRERVAILARRDDRLGRRLALLRSLLLSADPPVRTWLEPLPDGDAAAGIVLDELARA